MDDPSHCCNGGNGCSDEFDREQVSQFGWWDQEQWQLNDPEQEIADHALCGDSSGRRQLVLDVIVRGPDRSKHDGNALCTVGTLNTEPEHCQDTSRNDAKVSEVVAEGGSDNHRERNVKSCADGTVEDHRNRDTRGADNHDGDGVTPVETDSDDRGCCFPGTQVDSVCRPICHPGPQCPCLELRWDWVHVRVGPYSWRSKGRLLLRELPSFDRGASCFDGLFGVETGLDLVPARNELHHLDGR